MLLSAADLIFSANLQVLFIPQDNPFLFLSTFLLVAYSCLHCPLLPIDPLQNKYFLFSFCLALVMLEYKRCLLAGLETFIYVLQLRTDHRRGEKNKKLHRKYAQMGGHNRKMAYPSTASEKPGHPVFSIESMVAILGTLLSHDFGLRSPPYPPKNPLFKVCDLVLDFGPRR